MGKVSPTSIKYIIYAKFFAEGTVEKPDVIGAVFGQTEGLLGEDLELRELQKNGKIGRIEVSLNTVDSKTSGEIEIPTALDKAETTMIAATLETIEKVGPCDAKIKIEKIEDVRAGKREYVVSRAKELMAQITSVQPDSKELGATVTALAREAKIKEYGKEMLPAGPDLDGKEIIVVEGRADVLNLLRYGIKNVIGMNGNSLPEAIKELSKEKEITLFIDGDRGGILIAKNAIENATIAFIAQAPAGKEVEELVGKEIIYALRDKISSTEFVNSVMRKKTLRGRKRSADIASHRTEGEYFEEETEEKKELTDKQIDDLRTILDAMIGTKGACLLDYDLNVMKRFPLSEIQNLRRFGKAADILIIDGTVTNTVARIAEGLGCKYLVARTFAVTGKTRISLISV